MDEIQTNSTLPPSAPATKVGGSPRIFKNPYLDPAYRKVQRKAVDTARNKFKAENQKYKLLAKTNPTAHPPDAFQILTREYFTFLVDFADKNPEKARAYAFAKGKENPALQTVLTVKDLSPNSLSKADDVWRYFKNGIEDKRKYIKQSADLLKTKDLLEKLTPEVKQNGLFRFMTSSPIGDAITYGTQFAYSEYLTPAITRLKSSRAGVFLKKRLSPWLKNPIHENSVSKKSRGKAIDYLKMLNNAYLKKLTGNPNVQKLARALAVNKSLINPRKLPIPYMGANKLWKMGEKGISKIQPLTGPLGKLSKNSGKLFLGNEKNPFRPNRPTTKILSSSQNGGGFVSRPITHPVGWIGRKALRNTNPFKPNMFSRKGKQLAGKESSKIAKKIASKLTKTAIKSVIFSPPVLTGIAVTIVVIIFIFLIFSAILGGTLNDSGLNPGGGSSNPGQPQQPGTPTQPIIPGLTLQLDALTQVANGANIIYTVTVTIDSSKLTIPIEQITVYEEVPLNTTYTSSTGNGSFSNNVVSWPLSDVSNRQSFTFTLLPTSPDILITNKVYALATSAPSSNVGSTSDCNGYYTGSRALNNPTGNFGDPNCNFAASEAQAKSELYDSLKSQDPTHADYWYLKIIPCESGYNPNAYLAASTSGLGAYGLFQMNPTGSANGIYDSGNVNWPQQISNAINYNKQINESFAYWACR